MESDIGPALLTVERDLREIGRRTVAPSPPADAFTRCRTTASSRRRRKALSIGTASLAIAGAIAASVTVLSRSNSSTATVPATAGQGSPSANHVGQQLTRISSLTVRFLPPGVTFLAHRRNGDAQLIEAYSLPGLVNADTLPPGSIPASVPPSAHPQTQLTVSAALASTHDLQDLNSDTYHRYTWTTVQGHRAQLTQEANGYGIVRIDWIDPVLGIRYVVMNPRYKTSDGTSGLPVETLLSIANGVTAH